LIGISLEECKRLLGNVVETYSCEGRTESLEFHWAENQIVVTPVNDVILSVHLYQKTPFDFPAVLENLSGHTDWVRDFLGKAEVTNQFPGYAPHHPNHSYYQSADGNCVAMNRLFTMLGDWPYRLEIVTADFQERLKALPSKYDLIKPPPQQPFFFFQNRRFEAELGKTGEFDHFFGHSHNLTVQRSPPRGKLHQVVNLDLRDPALGMTIPGLTRLPLLYCFCFETGLVEYDLLADDQVRITRLDEGSFSDDCPYADYPNHFPKHSIIIGGFQECPLDKFGADVWQGIPSGEEKNFICIVPPSPLYGVHLWDEDSDCDWVHVKFFVDLKSRHVTAYNECD
jgi:hypothetical protein